MIEKCLPVSGLKPTHHSFRILLATVELGALANSAIHAHKSYVQPERLRTQFCDVHSRGRTHYLELCRTF